jgi:hypothetical protein
MAKKPIPSPAADPHAAGEAAAPSTSGAAAAPAGADAGASASADQAACDPFEGLDWAELLNGACREAGIALTEAAADFPRRARPLIEAYIARVRKAHGDLLADLATLVHAGELAAIEVRSRDGKPFRRAGFTFGDLWVLVEATAEQLQRLKADPGLQVRSPQPKAVA